MTILLWAVLYLAIGGTIAFFSAKHQFTTEFRWWHIIGWPLIVLIWLLVLAVLWGLS